MPRAKAPLKRELLRAELAERLGLDVADILTRPEVIAEYGQKLGYTNEKSLSNAGNSAPCFYKAEFGRHGLALYSRPELRDWLDGGDARRKMEILVEAGRPHPWPQAHVVKPVNPVTEEFLNLLTDDQEYKDKVLGRKAWA